MSGSAAERVDLDVRVERPLRFVLAGVNGDDLAGRVDEDRRRRPPDASAREGTARTELLRPSSDSAIVYLYSKAFMGVIAYVLVYLVK
jgi:hypothetical protein